MTESISQARSRRPLGLILGGLGVILVAVVAFFLGGRSAGGGAEKELATPAAAVTAAPQASATPLPTCSGDAVQAGLDQVVLALQENDGARAQSELDDVLSAYAGLMDQPACGPLAQELLGIQALVAVSTAWDAAQASGSVKQMEEAARLAALADELVGAGNRGELKALAAGFRETIEGHTVALAESLDPARAIADPATVRTELAGGLHPLCEVNTVIKPLLEDQSGAPIPSARRLAVYDETLYILAGGELLMADLDRVFGPSPALFLEPAGPEDNIVAGAGVAELVDLTRSDEGDLLLLEKSGRVLRRTPAGIWSLERQAKEGEMPVALAPYSPRFYLLDPEANQVWRYPFDQLTYLPAYFGDNVLRDTSRGVDMAIDGAIYVARSDGLVRRYFVGVQDPAFAVDTDLGSPVAIFLPDDPESTLVYTVDGPGRRVLGLDRESGAYRLGFVLNIEGVGPLTGGAIDMGRLYLTDGANLYVSVLNPTPTPNVDCPAYPFSPVAPFDRPELAAMELELPVSALLPEDPASYPGGRWPQIGYGVMEALVFSNLPVSDTVRAVAAGTVSRIVSDPALLLETDLGVISTTGVVPAESLEALWGKQIRIDHGDGIETRYGGLGEILPTLEEGQQVGLFTILGFAGEGPIYLGIWADGEYVGYGRSVPETIVSYRALFERDD